MQGGTTFSFITNGIHPALDQARPAAGAREVAIAGGAATVNQCLAAGLIDELRTHLAPVTLGRVNASSTASRRCPGAPGRPGGVAHHPHQLPRPPLIPHT